MMFCFVFFSLSLYHLISFCLFDVCFGAFRCSRGIVHGDGVFILVRGLYLVCVSVFTRNSSPRGISWLVTGL